MASWGRFVAAAARRVVREPDFARALGADLLADVALDSAFFAEVAMCFSLNWVVVLNSSGG